MMSLHAIMASALQNFSASAPSAAIASAPVFAAIVGGTLRTMNVQPDTALESAVVAVGGGSR